MFSQPMEAQAAIIVSRQGEGWGEHQVLPRGEPEARVAAAVVAIILMLGWGSEEPVLKIAAGRKPLIARWLVRVLVPAAKGKAALIFPPPRAPMVEVLADRLRLLALAPVGPAFSFSPTMPSYP